MAQTGGHRRWSDFTGRWTLDREIFHSDGAVARFAGKAQWVPDGKRLLYSESGNLTIQGQMAMVAERRYIWLPDLSVLFEDGRLFHKVPPTGGPTAHWCDPDHYEGVYYFDDWPRFTVGWQVQGPRKSYTMTSFYRPCPE